MAGWAVYDLFNGEKGELLCLTDYTKKRIVFLYRYIAGLEFDG